MDFEEGVKIEIWERGWVIGIVAGHSMVMVW